MRRYDIAIVGAGPGGYVAAIRAARLGASVALIERDEVGGVCLNRGCIPTKTIIASVNRLMAVRTAAEMGIEVKGEARADLNAIMARKNKVVSGLVKGIHQLIKANKIDLIKGNATFDADRSITVGGETIEASNIIIATGSSWRKVPGIEFDSRLILSSDDMLNLDHVPPRLAILGGGVIGCEFASIFSSLGSKVTIIEAMENILPMEDAAVSNYLARSFKKQGIEIVAGAMISSFVVRRSPTQNGVQESIEITLSNGQQIEFDKMLVAVGRMANIDGLEKLGLAIENGAVKTDEKMRTSVKGVYAIGDVNGKYMLAHVASQEGIVAVENIMGKDSSMDYSAVPRPIYTRPEACCVGSTEKELVKLGAEFKIGKYNYGATPKALCDGIIEGQVIVYSEEESGRILGAGLIGEHSTELASELALAISSKLSVGDISRAIHSHPTLSEVVKEAVEDCEGQAIHKVYK